MLITNTERKYVSLSDISTKILFDQVILVDMNFEMKLPVFDEVDEIMLYCKIKNTILSKEIIFILSSVRNMHTYCQRNIEK